jgi:hypothetical protein
MLWSDIILTARKNGNFTDKWKNFNYILPIFQGFNLLSICISLNLLFNIKFPLTINIIFISNVFLNKAISGILILFLPFFIINYFLILYKKRYKKIIINYKSYNGKILFYYMLISFIWIWTLILI